MLGSDAYLHAPDETAAEVGVTLSTSTKQHSQPTVTRAAAVLSALCLAPCASLLHLHLTPLTCISLLYLISHSPEVQEDVFHDVLQPWMRSRGYSSLYNRRAPAAGSTTVGPMDGVSLHFRDSMFT